MFLREGEDKNYTFPLHTPLYHNLKVRGHYADYIMACWGYYPLPVLLFIIMQAISHLPVSVVGVVAPDLVQGRPSPLSPSTLQALGELVAVLDRATGLVNEDNFPGQVGSILWDVRFQDWTAP